MASAVAHAYHGAKPYHNDIEPSNMLIEDNKNVPASDWEQNGAPTCSLAPEADVTFDIKEEDGRLAYTKHTGPSQQNND